MEHLWQTKPQKNNKLLIIGGAIMLFVSFHMVSIYRAKAQEDFARFVEKRIGIEEIQVEANDGVMILTGIGTKAQKEFAEKKATTYIQKLSSKVTNPPTEVRNEIKVKPNPKLGVKEKTSRNSLASRNH